MHRSVHLLVFVFFLCCIVTFEHVDALRRIKRGSLGTSSGPGTAKELAHDSHVDPNHKDESNNIAAAARLAGKSGVAASTSAVHTRSKKKTAPKTTIEKPISALLSFKANDDNKEKPADTSPSTRSTHAHLQYTNTAEIKPGYMSPLENAESAHKPRAPADSSVKELHKSPFTYWFDPRHSGWFDDAQLERTFSGDGPDVLIIDNSLQPAASERAAHNLRSAARSLKSLTDSGEQSGSGSGNATDNSKQRNNHNDNNNGRKDSSNSNASHNDNSNSGNNNNKNIDTDTKINGSAQNNVALNANNNNNNNGNNDSNSDNNKRERNNDSNAEKDNDSNGNNNARKIEHQSAASDNAISANNNFNSNAINNDGAQQQQLQQQEQQKMSVSPLLTLAEGNKADNGAMQLQRLQPAAAAHQNKEPQQLQSHFNGKMQPIDSMLKFANMLLYKMDGAPIHAQRAEVSINSSPTSVVSVGPNVESSDDMDTIDLFYNNLEPQLSPVIRFPQPLSIGGGTSPMLTGGPNALSPHPFVLPPFSFNEAPPPFNLLESALNLFLGEGGDDDGEDQIELRCPIHHEPKKKATEATAGGAANSSAEASSNESKDDDGKSDVIQVCSCRFFKKKKSA